jgi:hypothetical protein
MVYYLPYLLPTLFITYPIYYLLYLLPTLFITYSIYYLHSPLPIGSPYTSNDAHQITDVMCQ